MRSKIEGNICCKQFAVCIEYKLIHNISKIGEIPKYYIHKVLGINDEGNKTDLKLKACPFCFKIFGET